MGFRRRYIIGLLWRVGLLLLTAYGFVYSLTVEGLGAARVLAAFIFLGATAGLWRYIQRTNVELARFIEAMRFEDYTQRFSYRGGGGFDALGEALDKAMRSLADQRTGVAEEARYLSAVVDDAPVALLSIADDGSVTLLNKAARQQFGRDRRAESFRVSGQDSLDHGCVSLKG